MGNPAVRVTNAKSNLYAYIKNLKSKIKRQVREEVNDDL